MAHPLLGANIGTLARVFRDTGGPDRRLTALGLCGAALARLPFSALERALVAHRLARSGPIPPPVFILGHWRSGTTHLYELMSRAGFGYLPPVAAGLPWDMLLLGRLMRPLLERQLPARRFVDDMPVTPTSPQEDEIPLANMSPVSFYHALYFPRAFDRLIDRGVFFDGCREAEVAAWQRRLRYLLAKLALLEGRRLLVKNPAHTARPAMLRAMFPGAKFIHIHRNPLDVFVSMRNFYARLFEALALQRVPPGLDIDATILRVFARMMQRFEAETAGWQAPDFVEVSYELLDSRPLAALERIFRTLGLEGFEAALPAFRAHLREVGGHRCNRLRADPAARARATGALGPWIARWGYDAPASAGASR